MTKHIAAHTLLLIVVLYFSLPSISFSENSTNPSKKKIELTTLQVEQSIKLLPFFLKYSANKKKSVELATPTSLNQRAIKHGFQNYQEFLKSASVIMMAYTYLQLKSNEAVLSNQISKLKPDIAKAFKPQMESLAKSIKRYEEELSPVTVRAVLPYMSNIGAILNANK